MDNNLKLKKILLKDVDFQSTYEACLPYVEKDFNVLLDEFLESLQFEDNDLYERTKNGIVDIDELWVLFSQFMRKELKK